MHEVEIDATPLERLGALLEPERAAEVSRYAERARGLLAGRTVWNVNATATGGGVAEMLQALLAYGRGAGVDTRWLVLDGSPAFFGLTKRIHNLVHGSPGDGGPLGDAERQAYESLLEDNLHQLVELVKPDDIVLLHDPQTAGLVEGLRNLGAHVVWRSHIGRDTPTDLTERAWAFLQPYVDRAEAVIFSRKAYVPEWVDQEKVWLIPPSLDPFTAKNADISPEDVAAVLGHAGLLATPAGNGRFGFTRRDGSPGEVRPHTGLIDGGDPVPPGRVVLQVSRWDRLKDMAGVLTGFTEHLSKLPEDAQLMLVGPETAGVSDDPEGAEVFAECQALRDKLPEEARRRVHLCSLPMDDTDENAFLVNAIQRYATVVVQKSLVEGFGLTVTEPMWKSKPVIASRVGGIQDQIVDGESGVLLDDPADLESFGAALVELLADEDRARTLGENAHERVRDQYLGDRHLIQYVQLFEQIYGA